MRKYLQIKTYLQLLKNRHGETVKDFQKAFALESARKQGKNIPSQCILPAGLYYSERVKYTEQIERFNQFFPQGKVKVIVYDDWKRDNLKTYQDILLFLGVDSTFVPIIARHNEGGKVARAKVITNFLSELRERKKYWKIVEQLAFSIFPNAKLRNKVVSLLRKNLDNLLYTSAKSIDSEFKKELKQLLKPEVIALSKLLDRDLVALWNY